MPLASALTSSVSPAVPLDEPEGAPNARDGRSRGASSRTDRQPAGALSRAGDSALSILTASPLGPPTIDTSERLGLRLSSVASPDLSASHVAGLGHLVYR